MHALCIGGKVVRDPHRIQSDLIGEGRCDSQSMQLTIEDFAYEGEYQIGDVQARS